MAVAYGDQIQSWCNLRRSSCLSQCTTDVDCTSAPDCTPLMPIKGSNTRVRYVYCQH